MLKQLNAVALFFFGLASVARAEEIRKVGNERLSDVVNYEFGCSLALPFRQQTNRSLSRLGAINAGLSREVVASGSEMYRFGREQVLAENCTPTSALPEGSQGASLEGYRYYKGASASVKVEAGKIFKLLNISAQDIQEVKIDISGVTHRELNSSERRAVIREYLKDDGCSAALKSPKARMIMGTCAGTVALQLYFSKAFKIEAIQAKISALDISAEAGWMEEYGSEAKCADVKENAEQPKAKDDKTGAKKEEAKKDEGKKEESQKDGAKKDDGKKGANEAKKGTVGDVVDSVGSAVKAGADAIEKIKEATKPSDKPGEAGQKAEEGKKEESKPSDGAKKEADAGASKKCYKGVTLRSPADSVFGVVVSEQGGLEKLIKDVSKSK